MADVTQELLGLGIGLVVLVIALAFGAEVTEDIQSDVFCVSGDTYNSVNQTCGNGTHQETGTPTVAGNITSSGQDGLMELGLKVDTIAVIGAIAVILFMIIRIGVMARQ